jgi:hypothetical protein
VLLGVTVPFGKDVKLEFLACVCLVNHRHIQPYHCMGDFAKMAAVDRQVSVGKQHVGASESNKLASEAKERLSALEIEKLQDLLDRQTLLALRSNLEALDRQVELHVKNFDIRALKIGMLKLECIILFGSDAAMDKPAIVDQNPPNKEVTTSISKPLQKPTSASILEALSPAYDRRPKNKQQAKVQQEVQSAPRNNKRSSNEPEKVTKKARASTSDIPDHDSQPEAEVQKPKRRTMTPGRSQKEARSSIGSSSSKKNVKSKPKFAPKPSASHQNPFAAFDLTKRLAAPKLKGT